MPIVALYPLSLLLAGLASMVVGMLWYSPLMFGPFWMKEMGLGKKDVKPTPAEMVKMMGGGLILSIITAYVIRHLSTYAGVFYSQSGLSVSLTTAFFAWLGFTLPVLMNTVLYESRSLKLFAVNASYQFTNLMVIGFVIGLWG